METPLQRGFSLLGVMVALFVLVTGIIATTQIMARTTRTLHVSRNEFIATNLAREGLELIRTTRDSNWFKKNSQSQINSISPINWTDHPYQDANPNEAGICENENDISGSRTLTIDRDSSIGTHLAFVPPNPPATLPPQQLYLVNGQYTHTGSLDQASPFWRLVTIDCSNQTAEPAFITVTSNVTWPEDGRIKSVPLKTKLYNWYDF